VTIGLGTIARHPQHQPRPAAAHPAAPCGRPGHPLLGPTRKGTNTEEFLRDAHTDIPAVVEAMRQYWMPIRYARAG
jgi:hypothetical protein